MKRQDQKHYSIDRATGSSLWVCQCGWEKCNPSHSFGPAVRDHFLIHYVVRGSGVFHGSSGSYTLSKGQGFLISPGEVTTYTADKESPWEYCWVGFKGVDASYLLSRCSLDEKNPTFTCADTAKVKSHFLKMFEAFKENRGREYAMLAYLYLFFSELSAQNAQKSLPSANVKIYLNSALSYINDNFSYDINVKSLASHIGIDRTYLYRIFIESIGISPEQYILKVRMTKAANLLKESDCPVLQAAYSTGYKDLSHFSNIFKRFFGVSPSAYRKATLAEKTAQQEAKLN